jgi:hypothetical protein
MTDTYAPSTPHLRDSLQHDFNSTKSDLSPSVITSDASGFSAVLIFCNDVNKAHALFGEAYRSFQLVSADAANDASARMTSIHGRERDLEIREKEVADLKSLLEQRAQALKAIVGAPA